MCYHFIRAFEITASENKKVLVHLSDVRSLYPNQGISDAVIDFYVRYCMWVRTATRQLLYKIKIYRTWCFHYHQSQFVASSLSYSAIVDIVKSNLPPLEKRQRAQQRFKATCGKEPAELLDKDMLIFPCKVQYVKHEIMLIWIDIINFYHFTEVNGIGL